MVQCENSMWIGVRFVAGYFLAGARDDLRLAVVVDGKGT
jgi:hypothetical protein